MIEEVSNLFSNCKELVDILNLEGGSLNENFYVKTNNGAMYIQRNFLSYNHLMKIDYLMKIIKDAGIPLMINKKVLVLEDKNILIREFVEGRNYKLGNKEDLKTAVEILSKFHGIDISNKNNIKYKYISIHDPYHWIGNFEENYKKIELWSKRYSDLNFSLEILRENYYPKMKRNYEKLPISITHGDFHGGNLIYNEKNHDILSVIDFDTLGISSRICDISYSWLLLCREKRGSFEINQQLSDYFFEEYTKNITFKIDELKMLKSILIMRLMPTPEYLCNLERKRKDYFVNYLKWVRTAINSLDSNLKKIDERFFYE
ncbi:aminoglycoside phosphotransferase family protein [Streptococcus mutans]|uniref:aminoglycoside phosphotransferase family protein n=1 Tax=Streptococcus mutans TaxID=1309 RepID=UPI0002B56CD4|nr:aminoglycoside phosphotransferase family protein [Streptococcus mutans]EMC31723.1 hypothetical protein SMU86_02043 [Streptococcus mutans U2A]